MNSSLLAGGAMEDYHLHCGDDVRKAYLFISKIKEGGNNVKISFSEHESDRIYDGDIGIQKLGRLMGVHIEKSFTFISSEGQEIISIHPGRKSKNLLNEIKEEKLNRLVFILNYLKDLSIGIPAYGLCERIGLKRKDYDQLYCFQNEHIVEELMLEHRLTKRESQEIVEKCNLMFPEVKRKTTEEIIAYLMEDKNIYLANPSEHNENFDPACLTGFVLDKMEPIPERIQEMISVHGLEVKNGTGTNL